MTRPIIVGPEEPRDKIDAEREAEKLADRITFSALLKREGWSEADYELARGRHGFPWADRTPIKFGRHRARDTASHSFPNTRSKVAGRFFDFAAKVKK